MNNARYQRLLALQLQPETFLSTELVRVETELLTVTDRDARFWLVMEQLLFRAWIGSDIRDLLNDHFPFDAEQRLMKEHLWILSAGNAGLANDRDDRKRLTFGSVLRQFIRAVVQSPSGHAQAFHSKMLLELAKRLGGAINLEATFAQRAYDHAPADCKDAFRRDLVRTLILQGRFSDAFCLARPQLKARGPDHDLSLLGLALTAVLAPYTARLDREMIQTGARPEFTWRNRSWKDWADTLLAICDKRPIRAVAFDPYVFLAYVLLSRNIAQDRFRLAPQIKTFVPHIDLVIAVQGMLLTLQENVARNWGAVSQQASTYVLEYSGPVPEDELSRLQLDVLSLLTSRGEA